MANRVIQGVIYGLKRAPMGNRSPTHEWNSSPRENPIRIECIIRSNGPSRVRVEMVKLLDPTPEYLNAVDLTRIARLARAIVAEATDSEVARVTGDMILSSVRH